MPPRPIYRKAADWQKDVKIWIDKDDKYTDEYVIYKRYLYKDTDKEIINKVDYYYRIEDISLNELY